MRRYPFAGIRNMRDLGGYAARDGLETKWERFIRCGAPERATQEELDFLRRKGFTTVIDLRRPDEIEKTPSAFLSAEGFDCHAIEAYLSEGMPRNAEEMPILYFELTKEMNSIRAVMKIIAQARGGVIFHCSAGKDRTGVVAALLLMLAGVAYEDILADYQVSFTYIQDQIAELAEDVKDSQMFIAYSKVEYMAEFMRLFKKQYGSVEAYFDQMGLTDAEVEEIRAKLLK